MNQQAATPSTRASRLSMGIALAALLALALAGGWLLRDAGKPSPVSTDPAVAAIAGAVPAGPAGPSPHLATARFVGSPACVDCHAEASAAWRGSQHARAMQHANEGTVLGDFADARFRHAGVESRFFRRDGRYFVRTDGPDGRLADFELRYTFGVEPLQQYLVEFPDGRLQALSIAWDTRPKAEGGQRWFHLYPDQSIDHRDELHWTRAAQNWNFMCADCHATDVRKNHDADRNTFATRWAELAVGCEACHGPGSAHLEWANTRAADAFKGLTVRLDERRGVSWRIDPATGNAARSAPRTGDRELQVCAQCHARRSQVAEGYRAGADFHDHYRAALLNGGLYHADGQQREEVFVWGSFMQSRMQHAGVTCSDCHEPHSGALLADGNAVCAQCHSAAKYATNAHHRHGDSPDAAGTRCVDCHMAATTYMVVDPRRDHSFRVPRPDQTLALGTPNACNGCHAQRDAEWAVAALAGWNGRQPQGFQRYAEAFDAAERGAAQAGPALVAVARDVTNPAIARATALDSLARLPSPPGIAVAREALADSDPLLRRGAVAALTPLAPAERRDLLAPLLRDPVLTVRIEAADALADALAEATPAQRDDFEQAAAEFATVQRFNADRPESRAALGGFYARQGLYPEAQRHFESLLGYAPGFVPGYVNLADLHRVRGQETEGEATLRRGLRQAGDHASLRHALGLSLVRQKRSSEALVELRAATRLAPEDARFGYVYAVALHSSGDTPAALREIERSLQRHPDDRDLLMAGVTFADTGPQAERHARRLAERYPGDPGVARFLVEWAGR